MEAKKTKRGKKGDPPGLSSFFSSPFKACERSSFKKFTLISGVGQTLICPAL
jgi:hypothetical protein